MGNWLQLWCIDDGNLVSMDSQMNNHNNQIQFKIEGVVVILRSSFGLFQVFAYEFIE